MDQIGECPHCEMPVHVDFTEPGEWCADENIPNGEYIEKCKYCGTDYNIIIDWSPRLYVEELYE